MKKFSQVIKKSLITSAIFVVSFSVPGLSEGPKEIYEEYCSSCHDGGFKGWITGAPDLGDKEDWEPFLNKDLEKLTHNVLTGAEKHEKKGDCKNCSEDDLRKTIEYIIEKSK